MNICCVCGARPSFMKVAAVTRALVQRGGFNQQLVHTGQHYDRAMCQVMFHDLGLPEPDVNLNVNGGSHAVQTARIMQRFEQVVLRTRPDLVLVVGDVNSTLACALVAAKLHIPVAHVEAGLRSFDRRMPEEINRMMTDVLSDLLFVSESSGMVNLRREGISDDRMFFVGNVMIDTLLRHRDRADDSRVLEELALQPRQYAVLTLHRPSNVDDPTVLAQLLDALQVLQRDLPIVFPVHPRTAAKLHEYQLDDQLGAMDNVIRTQPLGYLDFLKLMAEAKVMLTDSGGIQEETTILSVPCLTLRDNTERPATIDAGWNRLVGNDAADILAGYQDIMRGAWQAADMPPCWDGRAAERIADHLAAWAGHDTGRCSTQRAHAALAAVTGR